MAKRARHSDWRNTYQEIPYEFTVLGYKLIDGSEGVGGYTTAPDDQGAYFSFFLKPAGKNARSKEELPEYYQYVPRKTSTRKSKAGARKRAYNMAAGNPLRTGTQRKSHVGIPPGTIYCAKDRQPVRPLAPGVMFTGGPHGKGQRKIMYGECPLCQGHIQKFVKMTACVVECPECGMRSEGRDDDYLCIVCREDAE
jgi:hypothetical protein